MRNYLEDSKLGPNSVNSPDNISRIKITEESEVSDSVSSLTPKEALRRTQVQILDNNKTHLSEVEYRRSEPEEKHSRLSKQLTMNPR